MYDMYKETPLLFTTNQHLKYFADINKFPQHAFLYLFSFIEKLKF